MDSTRRKQESRLSKSNRRYRRLGTSDEFFEFVDNLWGPHSIDRFANMENRKLLRFNSLYWNPGSESIDSFTCNWHEENNWLVPPVALAAKVINHLVKCRPVGTLIVPKWSSSPFWPLLFEEGLHYKPYVEDVFEFLEANRIFVAGHNVNSIFAQGDLKGTVLAKIFTTGFWKHSHIISHPQLKTLFQKLSSTVLDSRAKTTVSKYIGYFKRFVLWTRKYSEITSILPCNELHVSLYLQHLIDNSSHYSVIEAAFYGIKWAHHIAGVKNPCDSDFVRSIIDASKRLLSRPIQKKTPVDPEIMKKTF
ncbi:Hypothetical predicted protein [Mytilus galloprovincialis]|uniref:Uncharacterized protein n=1 Tax=Mytilus galloprovincialis TaxID=29158 RepID=A0A8B6BZD7_MYTGA|nr:Hypothetical predicted protein [Mytilus galloprovincialis]